jgi:hypothetical protein
MDPMDCSTGSLTSRLLDLPDELKLEVVRHVSSTASVKDMVLIDLIA